MHSSRFAILVVAAACDAGAPASSRTAPVACSTASPGRTIEIATGLALVERAPSIRWRSARDGHIYDATRDPVRPEDLGVASAFAGTRWDDTYWYRVVCVDDCDDGAGPKGGVERIDKRTGAAQRLGDGDYGLGNITLFGDYVYWGNYGHSPNDGGVRRVLRRNGPQESIRIWDGREEHIQSLTPYPGRGVLAVGTVSVAWIAGTGDRGTIMFDSDMLVGDAVVDGDFVYLTERDQRFDRRPGHIYRVSLATRAVLRLTGPLDQPARIALHGGRVYFTLDDNAGIWSVPTAGGVVTRTIGDGPYDLELGEEPLGLWAHPCGLVWLRGNPAVPSTQRLLFQPWP